MSKTSFTLTAADAGTVIGSRDGFIVSLKLVRPPDHLNPQPRIGAHFTLRDDRQDVSPGLRNVISYDPFTWGNPSGSLWRGASVSYAGELRVISVPPGSEWAITLSDVPNPKRKAA